MSAALRWGFLGTGKIARTFARDMALIDEGDLVAVASRELGRARVFADEFSVARAYGSYEELRDLVDQLLAEQGIADADQLQAELTRLRRASEQRSEARIREKATDNAVAESWTGWTGGSWRSIYSISAIDSVRSIYSINAVRAINSVCAVNSINTVNTVRSV